MFVDHSLWPPPPSEPPKPQPRKITEAEEKRIGWVIVGLILALVFGPLAGSSVIVGIVAVWHALVG